MLGCLKKCNRAWTPHPNVAGDTPASVALWNRTPS